MDKDKMLNNPKIVIDTREQLLADSILIYLNSIDLLSRDYTQDDVDGVAGVIKMTHDVERLMGVDGPNSPFSRKNKNPEKPSDKG